MTCWLAQRRPFSYPTENKSEIQYILAQKVTNNKKETNWLSAAEWSEINMFTLFAGPCVIESEDHALRTCEALIEITEPLGIPLVFKSSFDKANRTSIDSFRGPGIYCGMEILKLVKDEFFQPIMTDIHEPWQAEVVAETVDYIQIPALLCRQTDLLIAAGTTGKTINIKKSQLLSGKRMKEAVEKVYRTGNRNVIVCERGTSFGYEHLIVDMRNIVDMKSLGIPVMFDATHSIQVIDIEQKISSGEPQYVPYLAAAAIAAGADHLFMEVHESPNEAKSDSACMIRLSELKPMLEKLKRVYEVINGEVNEFTRRDTL